MALPVSPWTGVAGEAGVAKGSLYRYFRSKRELLEFVHGKLVDPLFQHMEELEIKQLPALTKLREHIWVLLEHVAKHAQIHKLLFEDDMAHGLLQTTERRTTELAIQRLANLFRQGITEGVFRPGDPLMHASLYLGLCKGVLERRPALETQAERESVLQIILGTFLDGIAAKTTVGHISGLTN